MMFRVPARCPFLPHHHIYSFHRFPASHRLRAPILVRHLHAAGSSPSSFTSGGSSKGGSLLVPGATVATLLMLAILHARRLYNDKKVEDMRENTVELEFSPDVKAEFLKLMPLRSISRLWGFLTSVEIPLPLRPFAYKAWARAFHTNLDEVALPLEEYASLKDFFVHKLKEGSRPINLNPHCLVSPVDGKVLRCGELKGPGAMIEQVKGFSYSAASLLGSNAFLPGAVDGEIKKEYDEEKELNKRPNKQSWWRISFASPKLRDSVSTGGGQAKGVFYCVIYLKPGEYHRVHSPVDWHVYLRRHFTGNLFPLNERATRTIKNLHVENERVVLEGQWEKGFMAVAAIGAMNVGSIELFIEPELKTNRPKKMMHSEPPDVRVYKPDGVGISLKKGDELAAFNMGSTVVLVFQAPISGTSMKSFACSDFKFSVTAGDRIRVGEPIGRWDNS